jgi:hypothetical protein
MEGRVVTWDETVTDGAESKRTLEEPDIYGFFRDYVAAFNRSLGESPDLETVRRSFAPCFVAAGPTGVICGQNDESFSEVLEKGYAFYRSIGTRSMTLLRVDLTLIDANHQMARVFYSSEYERPDGDLVTIDFDVTYLLHIENGKLQIFAYVAGDERALLRERGLLAE